MRWVVHAGCAAIALGGCGRLAFDPLTNDATGNTGDGACTQWGSFSAPMPLPGPVTTAMSEWRPWISADGLSLYYHVIYTDIGDLYVATRATPSDPFSNPHPVSELNTAEREADPTLSADGKTIIYDALIGAGNVHLMQATRANPSLPFDPPTLLAGLDTASDELSAALTPDGLEMYFVRSSATTTIEYSTRSDTSQLFTTSVTVPGTEVAGSRNHHVMLSPDLRELYVSSDRPGGAGNYDVYVAARAMRGDPFGAFTRIPELSSAGDDGVESMSADGTTAYVVYNTNFGGTGHISTAVRSCQ